MRLVLGSLEALASRLMTHSRFRSKRRSEVTRSGRPLSRWSKFCFGSRLCENSMREEFAATSTLRIAPGSIFSIVPRVEGPPKLRRKRVFTQPRSIATGGERALPSTRERTVRPKPFAPADLPRLASPACAGCGAQASCRCGSNCSAADGRPRRNRKQITRAMGLFNRTLSQREVCPNQMVVRGLICLALHSVERLPGVWVVRAATLDTGCL